MDYDWFCVQWPFIVMLAIIFSVALFLVVLGLWGGYKATRKIRQQREDLHWKRMSFYHISQLPETLPSKSDDALTFEELYHFFRDLYADTFRIHNKEEDVLKALDQVLIDTSNLYTNLKPKKGTKRK